MIKNLSKLLVLCLSLGAAVCTKSKVPKVYSHQVATSAQLSTIGASAPIVDNCAASNVGQPQDSKPPYPPAGGSVSAPSQTPAALADDGGDGGNGGPKPPKSLLPAPKDPSKNPDPDDEPKQGGDKPPLASPAVEQAKKQYEGFTLCIDQIKARQEAVNLAQLQDRKAIKAEIDAIGPYLVQAGKLVAELETLFNEATKHNAPDAQPLKSYLELAQQAFAQSNDFKQKLVDKNKEIKEKNPTKFQKLLTKSNRLDKAKPKDKPPVSDKNNNSNTRSNGIGGVVDLHKGAGQQKNTAHTSDAITTITAIDPKVVQLPTGSGDDKELSDKEKKKKGFKQKLAKLGKKMFAKIAHKKAKPVISFYYEHQYDVALRPMDEVDGSYQTTAALKALEEWISEVIENLNSEEVDAEELDHAIGGIEREFDKLEKANLDDAGYNQLENLAQRLASLEKSSDLSDDEADHFN